MLQACKTSLQRLVHPLEAGQRLRQVAESRRKTPGGGRPQRSGGEAIVAGRHCGPSKTVGKFGTRRAIDCGGFQPIDNFAHPVVLQQSLRELQLEVGAVRRHNDGLSQQRQELGIRLYGLPSLPAQRWGRASC